jgi:hypothetical protein
MRARSFDERAFACPEPCPELGISEPTSANAERRTRAKNTSRDVKAGNFKTGKPVQPTGWKVRFLRRSASGIALVAGRPVGTARDGSVDTGCLLAFAQGEMYRRSSSFRKFSFLACLNRAVRHFCSSHPAAGPGLSGVSALEKRTECRASERLCPRNAPPCVLSHGVRDAFTVGRHCGRRAVLPGWAASELRSLRRSRSSRHSGSRPPRHRRSRSKTER